MYRLARRGIVVDAPASVIWVERFDLAPTNQPDLWSYLMVVSTGTYVRAVVRDLGLSLGCGAAVSTLRRTAIGPLRVEDALCLPSDPRGRCPSRLILDTMPLHLPAIAGPGDALRFAGGVVSRRAQLQEASLVAVRDDGGRLHRVGDASLGTLRPRVVLPRKT
jgi:hypothetical protein